MTGTLGSYITVDPSVTLAWVILLVTLPEESVTASISKVSKPLAPPVIVAVNVTTVGAAAVGVFPTAALMLIIVPEASVSPSKFSLAVKVTTTSEPSLAKAASVHSASPVLHSIFSAATAGTVLS